MEALERPRGWEGPMRCALTAAMSIALVSSPQWVAAQPALKDLAARTELRALQSLTLSDRQFLSGDRNGRPALLAGQLRLPQRTKGRLPAVILLHASGGPTAN